MASATLEKVGGWGLEPHRPLEVYAYIIACCVCGCVLYIGSVKVTYYSSHHGHDCEVAHQQLTRSQRSQSASMLAMGIPFEDVIDRVQLSGNNSSVSRLHFTSKQDLKNIVRDFNLTRGTTYSANDADSVATWISLHQIPRRWRRGTWLGSWWLHAGQKGAWRSAERKSGRPAVSQAGRCSSVSNCSRPITLQLLIATSRISVSNASPTF